MAHFYISVYTSRKTPNFSGFFAVQRPFFGLLFCRCKAAVFTLSRDLNSYQTQYYNLSADVDKDPSKSLVFQRFFLLERLPLTDAATAVNGIQEVSGSIPLISTKNNKPQGQRLAVLLYLQVRIHPLPHQYTAFNDDGKLEFPYTLSVPPRGCQLHGRGQSKHDVHIHFRKHSATGSAGSQYNSLLHRLW